MAAEQEKGAVVAVGCMAMIVMLPFTILLRGFVLTQLWHWFLVPLGLREISLAHAYGLSILIALFTSHTASSSKEDQEKGIAYLVFKMVFMGFAMPLIMWFFGWVCYCFM